MTWCTPLDFKIYSSASAKALKMDGAVPGQTEAGSQHLLSPATTHPGNGGGLGGLAPVHKCARPPKMHEQCSVIRGGIGDM